MQSESLSNIINGFDGIFTIINKNKLIVNIPATFNKFNLFASVLQKISFVLQLSINLSLYLDNDKLLIIIPLLISSIGRQIVKLRLITSQSQIDSKIHEQIITLIQECPRIVALNFAGAMQLEPKYLYSFMSSIPRLKKLNLCNYVHITQDFLHAIAEYFLILSKLNLSACANLNIELLLQLLLQNLGSLKTLILAQTNLCPQHIQKLARLKTLEKVSLAECTMVDTSSLITLFTHNKLTSIDITGITFDAEQLTPLLNSKLQKISLSQYMLCDCKEIYFNKCTLSYAQVYTLIEKIPQLQMLRYSPEPQFLINDYNSTSLLLLCSKLNVDMLLSHKIILLNYLLTINVNFNNILTLLSWSFCDFALRDKCVEFLQTELNVKITLTDTVCIHFKSTERILNITDQQLAQILTQLGTKFTISMTDPIAPEDPVLRVILPKATVVIINNSNNDINKYLFLLSINDVTLCNFAFYSDFPALGCRSLGLRKSILSNKSIESLCNNTLAITNLSIEDCIGYNYSSFLLLQNKYHQLQSFSLSFPRTCQDIDNLGKKQIRELLLNYDLPNGHADILLNKLLSQTIMKNTIDNLIDYFNISVKYKNNKLLLKCCDTLKQLRWSFIAIDKNVIFITLDNNFKNCNYTILITLLKTLVIDNYNFKINLLIDCNTTSVIELIQLIGLRVSEFNYTYNVDGLTNYRKYFIMMPNLDKIIFNGYKTLTTTELILCKQYCVNLKTLVLNNCNISIIEIIHLSEKIKIKIEHIGAPLGDLSKLSDNDTSKLIAELQHLPNNVDIINYLCNNIKITANNIVALLTLSIINNNLQICCLRWIYHYYLTTIKIERLHEGWYLFINTHSLKNDKYKLLVMILAVLNPYLHNIKLELKTSTLSEKIVLLLDGLKSAISEVRLTYEHEDNHIFSFLLKCKNLTALSFTGFNFTDLILHRLAQECTQIQKLMFTHCTGVDTALLRRWQQLHCFEYCQNIVHELDTKNLLALAELGKISKLNFTGSTFTVSSIDLNLLKSVKELSLAGCAPIAVYCNSCTILNLMYCTWVTDDILANINNGKLTEVNLTCCTQFHKTGLIGLCIKNRGINKINLSLCTQLSFTDLQCIADLLLGCQLIDFTACIQINVDTIYYLVSRLNKVKIILTGCDNVPAPIISCLHPDYIPNNKLKLNGAEYTLTDKVLYILLKYHSKCNQLTIKNTKLLTASVVTVLKKFCPSISKLKLKNSSLQQPEIFEQLLSGNLLLQKLALLGNNQQLILDRILELDQLETCELHNCELNNEIVSKIPHSLTKLNKLTLIDIEGDINNALITVLRQMSKLNIKIDKMRKQQLVRLYNIFSMDLLELDRITV